jgi:hypothetical protein
MKKLAYAMVLAALTSGATAFGQEVGEPVFLASPANVYVESKVTN